VSKNKKSIHNNIDRLTKVGADIGITLMSLATVIGMVELPNHPNSRIITPGRVAFSMATAEDEGLNNPLRREREESAPHYSSYSVTQRTPSKSGKR
jgi:hypothetical protein